MRGSRRLSVTALSLFAGTFVLMGLGVGMELASGMSPAQERAVGRDALLAGAGSFVPLGLEVFLIAAAGSPASKRRGGGAAADPEARSAAGEIENPGS